MVLTLTSSQKSRDSSVPSLLLLTLENTGVLDEYFGAPFGIKHLKQEMDHGWRISLAYWKIPI